MAIASGIPSQNGGTLRQRSVRAALYYAMKRRLDRASDAPVVFHQLGQSNGKNKTTYASGAGEDAFIARIATKQKTPVTYINSAVGSSYITKTAADAFSSSLYWWNDQNGTPGTLLTDAIADLDNPSEVTDSCWTTGEGEGRAIFDGHVTKSLVKSTWKTAIDYYRANTSGNLVQIDILGRRTNSAYASGWQSMREICNEIAEENSYIVYGAECYDIAMQDETGVGDQLHRASYVKVSERNAMIALRRKKSVHEGDIGPVVAVPSFYNDYTIRLPIKHDAGTAFLGSANKTPNTSKKGFLRAFNSAGTEIVPKLVTDNGLSIDLELPFVPLEALTVYGGYGEMYNLDLDKLFLDNSSDSLPLRTFKKTATPSQVGTGFTVQNYSVSLGSGVTSNTAAITSVDTTKTFCAPRGIYAAVNDSGGSPNTWSFRHALTSSTVITGTRASSTGMTQTLVMVGSTITLPARMIESVQTGEITLTGTSATGTGTITAVDTSRSEVMHSGVTSSSAQQHNLAHELTLTGPTQVTATASTTVTSSTRIIRYTVLQYQAAAFKRKESFNIAIATGQSENTFTLAASQKMRNTLTMFRGVRKTAGTDNGAAYSLPAVWMQDETTYKAARGASSATESLAVCATTIEFNEGYISVQRGRTTIPDGSTTQPQSIIYSPTANTWLNDLGRYSDYTGSAEEGRYHGYMEQTTNLNINHGKANSGNALTSSWEAIVGL